ncbi:hypothetical protein M3Y99_00610300 [Aphelenchoides fujianensis]|nr:hypothetical protein M3Y99_00610300 [Aphelenchoides fujianensis]
MPPRRLCFPHCKAPDKRDFMDIDPEKNAEDFYRNYDPLVGVGTVAILFSIIVLASFKSIIRCIIRRYRMWTYDRKLKQLRSERTTPEPKEVVTFLKDELPFVARTNSNGMI